MEVFEMDQKRSLGDFNGKLGESADSIGSVRLSLSLSYFTILYFADNERQCEWLLFVDMQICLLDGSPSPYPYLTYVQPDTSCRILLPLLWHPDCQQHFHCLSHWSFSLQNTMSRQVLISFPVKPIISTLPSSCPCTFLSLLSLRHKNTISF